MGPARLSLHVFSGLPREQKQVTHRRCASRHRSARPQRRLFCLGQARRIRPEENRRRGRRRVGTDGCRHADPLDRCARAALRWRRWLLLRARRGMGSATLQRGTARSAADRRAAPLADRQHGRAHDVPLNRCPPAARINTTCPREFARLWFPGGTDLSIGTNCRVNGWQVCRLPSGRQKGVAMRTIAHSARRSSTSQTEHRRPRVRC